MLGIEDAEHEETAPGAPALVVSKLACSLVGTTQMVEILPGSLLRRAYGRGRAREQFACNYGLNPQFRDQIDRGPLKVTGVDADGEARAVELGDHPFFVATLFLPQASSAPESPHPLIVAYLKAALALRRSGWDVHRDMAAQCG